VFPCLAHSRNKPAYLIAPCPLKGQDSGSWAMRTFGEKGRLGTGLERTALVLSEEASGKNSGHSTR
jgi:hypothetical protein